MPLKSTQFTLESNLISSRTHVVAALSANQHAEYLRILRGVTHGQTRMHVVDYHMAQNDIQS